MTSRGTHAFANLQTWSLALCQEDTFLAATPTLKDLKACHTLWVEAVGRRETSSTQSRRDSKNHSRVDLSGPIASKHGYLFVGGFTNSEEWTGHCPFVLHKDRLKRNVWKHHPKNWSIARKKMKSLDKPLVKGLSLGSVPGVGNFLDIENTVKQCRHPVIYIIQLYVYSVLYQYAKICVYIYIYTCLYYIYIYMSRMPLWQDAMGLSNGSLIGGLEHCSAIHLLADVTCYSIQFLNHAKMGDPTWRKPKQPSHLHTITYVYNMNMCIGYVSWIVGYRLEEKNESAWIALVLDLNWYHANMSKSWSLAETRPVIPLSQSAQMSSF